MSILPKFNALTASAKILPPEKKLTPEYDSWQTQLWDYYDRLGEFEAGISWRANTMSRVRLLAAELQPGGEEPIPITDGPAAEAMERLAGGTGGQSQLMKEMTIHLSVPGEGWLVGEIIDEMEKWYVASADELRVSRRTKGFEIKEDEDNKSYRQLSQESVVVRFWNAHPRFGWRATSDAKHAIDAMLELDLINKRIVAEITSRLASNGILLYDKDKLSFPSVDNPQDATSTDPFAEVLVDVASRGIKNPTSAEATSPIPIGFSLQDLTDVDPGSLLQHVKMADFLDEKLLLERESAIKRLATSLDMPPEVLLGVSGLNHWGAWQVEETGIKIHIAPFAERIAHSLTTGYLIPSLRSQNEDTVGPNGGKIVVWYDPSEITVRPDRSGNTLRAYDRGEVSGRVLRREIGLSEEGDAPTQGEYREWLTRLLGRHPATASGVLESMGGPTITPISAQPSDTDDVSDDNVGERTEPGTPDFDDDDREFSFESIAEWLNRNQDTMTDNDFAILLRSMGIMNGNQSSQSGWKESSVPSDVRVTPIKRNNGG